MPQIFTNKTINEPLDLNKRKYFVTNLYLYIYLTILLDYVTPLVYLSRSWITGLAIVSGSHFILRRDFLGCLLNV